MQDLQRQIKQTVSKHHNALLAQAASVSSLSGDLSELRRGVSEVEGGVQRSVSRSLKATKSKAKQKRQRLKKKINTPYNDLSSAILVQSRLTKITHLARQAHRFTVLCRRLESQVANAAEANTANRPRSEKERTIREAAVILAELDSLLPPSSRKGKEHEDLRSLDVVAEHLPFVNKTRTHVLQTVAQSMAQALDTLDASLLLHSFSTANSLNMLASILSSHLNTLFAALSTAIKTSLDIASLSRLAAPQTSASQTGLPNPLSSFGYNYKSRARHEPSQNEKPAWTKAFWERMERAVNEIEATFEKVDLVEKCLDRLDGGHNVRETMDREPVQHFWTSLSEAWTAAARDSVKASSFMQSTFASSYPRFLRLLRDFFDKSTAAGSGSKGSIVLVMTSVSPLEQIYLNRCTGRLNETVTSSFSLSSALSNFTAARPATPTANEGANVARVILNELDAVRFDEELSVKVARIAQRTIEQFRQKTDGLVYHDHSATTLLGPLATPAQVANRDIVGALFALYEPIQKGMKALPPPAQEVMTYGTTVSRFLSFIAGAPGADARNRSAGVGEELFEHCQSADHGDPARRVGHDQPDAPRLREQGIRLIGSERVHDRPHRKAFVRARRVARLVPRLARAPPKVGA